MPEFKTLSLADVFGAAAKIKNARTNEQLGQLRLQDYMQKQNEHQKFRDIASQAVDPNTGQIDRNKLTSGLATGGLPGMALEYDDKNRQRDITDQQFKLNGYKLALERGRYVRDQNSYNSWQKEMIQNGLLDEGEMSETYDPNAFNEFMSATKKEADKFGTPEEIPGMPGHVGQKNLTTGQYTNIKDIEEANRKRIKEARTSDAKEAKDLVESSSKLRKEYNQLSKDFISIRDARNRVIAAGSDPSAAGDLALIFNYMKVLDPSSVVRESEFATAENAGSVPERTRAAYNKVLRGERLSEPQRKDFLDRTERLYKPQRKSQQRLMKSYSELSKTFEIDPKHVVVNYLDPETTINDEESNSPLSPEERAELERLRALKAQRGQ